MLSQPVRNANLALVRGRAGAVLAVGRRVAAGTGGTQGRVCGKGLGGNSVRLWQRKEIGSLNKILLCESTALHRDPSISQMEDGPDLVWFVCWDRCLSGTVVCCSQCMNSPCPPGKLYLWAVWFPSERSSVCFWFKVGLWLNLINILHAMREEPDVGSFLSLKGRGVKTPLRLAEINVLWQKLVGFPRNNVFLWFSSWFVF